MGAFQRSREIYSQTVLRRARWKSPASYIPQLPHICQDNAVLLPKIPPKPYFLAKCSTWNPIMMYFLNRDGVAGRCIWCGKSKLLADGMHCLRDEAAGPGIRGFRRGLCILSIMPRPMCVYVAKRGLTQRVIHNLAQKLYDQYLRN